MMEDRERVREPLVVVIVAVLMSVSTLVAPTTATILPDSSHTTLFVTLPTPLSDVLPTVYPTSDHYPTTTIAIDQDTTDQGAITDYPTTVTGAWEGGSEARSALLRITPNDRKMTFLADDREAASRIPSLINQSGRSDVAAGVGGGASSAALFPKTRTRDKIPLGHSTGRNTGLGDYMDSTSDLEVGSRHHYRPYPAHLPARRPPALLPAGPPSFIDKQVAPGHSYSTRLRRPYHNLTRVLNIEAECQDDFMRIQVQFNGSFTGLVYSSGYSNDGECIYVNGSSRLDYNFYIELNRCGTLSGNQKGRQDLRGRQPSKNVMWNTLTVQYNPLIEEVWDEHFKVTCEYGYDFWKTVTFPFLDVEVQTGNPVVFTLTPPECHMEIRYGLGTSGTRVTGPVRVGDPLTLVIYMRSEYEGFDIVVSDCYAHNGGNKRIALIDHYGCPIDETLISHFEGERTNEEGHQTQVYAFLKTFRFTGSPALYLQCDVRMCHGDCPQQPCHWRNGKKKQRRSVVDEGAKEEEEGMARPANVSESLSLSQSLQVVRDDQMLRSVLRDAQAGKVCLEGGTVSAMASAVAVVVGVLTSACGVLCLRLRRNQKQQQQQHPVHSTNFLTTTTTTRKNQQPYKGDFVPPTKRRLE